MSVRDIVRDGLKVDEGLILKAYKDTMGKLTIGYGRNLDANGISESEAEIMLDNDIDNSIAEASLIVLNFNRIPEDKQSVIVCMIFNLGKTGFSKFVHLIDALEKADWKAAAMEIRNSAAYHQLPRRYERYAMIMES